MKEVYISILLVSLLPFIDMLHVNQQENIKFQQNNVTLHSSSVIRKWLENEVKKHRFSIMQWPFNSPDLNSIEYL